MGRVSYPSHEILQIWKQSASAIQEKNCVAILETREVIKGSSYLCQRFWPGVTECDFEVNLGMWSSLKQLLFKSKLRRKIQSTGPFWGQSFVAICFDFLWFYASYGSHVFCLPVEVGWQEMQFWKLDLEKGGCLTCVCSRHLEWPLHMGPLQCWYHACHPVSHGLVGTSCLLPGLKREELLSVSNPIKAPSHWALSKDRRKPMVSRGAVWH